MVRDFIGERSEGEKNRPEWWRGKRSGGMNGSSKRESGRMRVDLT